MRIRGCAIAVLEKIQAFSNSGTLSRARRLSWRAILYLASILYLYIIVS